MYQDTYRIPPFYLLSPYAALLDPVSVAISLSMIEIIINNWFFSSPKHVSVRLEGQNIHLNNSLKIKQSFVICYQPSSYGFLMPNWSAPTLVTVKIYVITKLNTLAKKKKKKKVNSLVPPEIPCIATLHIDVPCIFSNSTINSEKWGEG